MNLPDNRYQDKSGIDVSRFGDGSSEYAPSQFGPRNRDFSESQKDEFGQIFPPTGETGQVKSKAFEQWQQAVNEGVLPTVDYKGNPATFDNADLFLDHARKYGPKRTFRNRPQEYKGPKQ